jgi:hypothetical protein
MALPFEICSAAKSSTHDSQNYLKSKKPGDHLAAAIKVRHSFLEAIEQENEKAVFHVSPSTATRSTITAHTVGGKIS